MESVEHLIGEARAQTGLDDFGDAAFMEGLDRLVRSLREEANLSAVGEMTLRQFILGPLVQRLQIEDWYRRHPEIDDEPIDAPLIGLGLPRTGSTALSFLLAEDPSARSLRRWEAPEPCPPPSTVEGHDPRIDRARASVDAMQELAPRFAAMLPSSATGPNECQDLMALDFKSHYFQAFAYIPSYSSWLLHEADLISTYAYERRALKLLQWGAPTKPWRLKCPSHLLWLDHLDRVFPDARFVWTHRDPAEVMVSVADLYVEMAARFGADIDPSYFGALNVEHWAVGMERALAFRERGNDERFYDIDFRAMQREPIAQIHGLYEWLGAPVSEEFEVGMQRWWREHAAKRQPNVHPDPATFGLDLDRVRPRFTDYTARSARWTGVA